MNSNLPQSVVERLQAERERIENGAFSSALGVGEMLLARASGYRVLGQVMGASVYQFGGQWTRSNWRNNWQARLTEGSAYELTAQTAALTAAREAALGRLRAEAQLLNAVGIVGVRLRLQPPVGAGENQLEITAIGTAVACETSAAPHDTVGVAASFALPRFSDVAAKKSAPTEPFTSNLSGEETWKLERAGYAPCGLVMGNCAIVHNLSVATHYKIELAKTARFGVAAPPQYVRQSSLTQQQSSISQFERACSLLEKQIYAEWKRNPSGNFEVEEYARAVYNARESAIARLEAEARNCGASGIVGVQIDIDKNPFLPQHTESSHAVHEATFAFMATGTAIRALPRADAPNLGIEPVINLT